MEIVRIPEDPDIPTKVANRAFRQAAKDPDSVLVVAWSQNRWARAATDWTERTGRRPPKLRLIETDHERWNFPARTQFADRVAGLLRSQPVKLLVISDDFVILPLGMPGGHLFAGAVGYCPICDLWHDGTGAGC